MTESTAAIYGLEGLILTKREEAFFSQVQPWGYILFARNIATAQQVRALTDSLRALSKRQDLPIFIDQEGGRVQRVKPPIAPIYPTGEALGKIYKQDKNQGLRAAWLMSRLHAFDLTKLGINANCLPVLDVPVQGAHDVIGDRAYGFDVQTIIDLGQAASDGLLSGNCLPVMKHIPGHGRAGCDSHKDLPTVDASVEALKAQDFKPFQALAHYPMAMTAHVVYASLDPQAPATTSRIIIQNIIRDEIGFNGLLMSDDVSMHALSGDFSQRAKSILGAGCDIVLHCNGDMSEMEAIAKEVPPLSGISRKRAEAATDLLNATCDTVDEQDCRNKFASIMDAI